MVFPVYLGFVYTKPMDGPMAQSKPKSGRPKRTDNPQRLVTRLPGALKKRLQHRAIEEGRPAGAIIADAIQEYLGARERRRT